LAQVSPQLGWHCPSPQVDPQHGLGQSAGQLLQVSPQLGWHCPSPQVEPQQSSGQS